VHCKQLKNGTPASGKFIMQCADPFSPEFMAVLSEHGISQMRQLPTHWIWLHVIFIYP